MKKPSIQDVAERAKVGTSTVSRVLNNHPNVSPRAKERVLRAIEELAYLPNLAAQRLRSGQTNAVSVLLPMIGTDFYGRLLGSISTVLGRAGLDTALFPVVSGLKLERYREPSALPYYADGLLFASLDPERMYEGQPPFAKPIVLVDAYNAHYHSVYFDNLAAGRLAAEHALGLGLPIVLIEADVSKIAGAFGSPVFNERQAGIEQVLNRAGVKPFASYSTTIALESGRLVAQTLLEHPLPEAFTILAACDDIAIGVLRHLNDAGYATGQDVRVIGFDDQPAAAEAGLSSIHQPVEAMGTKAAEVLLEALEGKLTSIQQHRFAPELVCRHSTQGQKLVVTTH